jgi:hypothetical protein
MRAWRREAKTLIALIAGIDMQTGPVPIALGYAGIETRPVATTDEVEEQLGRSGAERCVLVLDARGLDVRAGRSTWSALLSRQPALRAVIVAHQDARAAAASAIGAQPHRLLAVDPFDAAAIVAAVRRVNSPRLPGSPLRRAPLALRDTG